jgi:hypothetical protein
LEEHAEVGEAVEGVFFVLDEAEAFGVGEDDGAAAGLEVAEDGGEPVGPVVDPGVGEDVAAEVGVSGDLVLGEVEDGGVEVELSAGVEAEGDGVAVEELLEVGDFPADLGDGVVREVGPEVGGADELGVAALDDEASDVEGFVGRARPVVDGREEVGVDFDQAFGHGAGW